MNRDQALVVLSTLSTQSAYFKSLDITSQLTQLNSLTKVPPIVDLLDERRKSLDKCIAERKQRLILSLDVLFVLEDSMWGDIVQGLGLVKTPIVSGKVLDEPCEAEVLIPVV